MKIRSLELNNYKSFISSTALNLSGRFNVIIGQNNSGKSALLEASALPAMGNNPYRDVERSQNFQVNPFSTVELELTISGAEILDSALQTGNMVIVQIDPKDEAGRFEATKRWFQDADIHVSGVWQPGKGFKMHSSSIAGSAAGSRKSTASVSPARGVSLSSASTGIAVDDLIAAVIRRKVFGLKAERFNIGRMRVKDEQQLTADASNLPLVLNHIQGNDPAAFDALNAIMSDIFPSIARVSAALENEDVVVRIWKKIGIDGVGISVPLSDSGTGISQALAILTAATITDAGLIVVDEISSFMHPQAVKKLLTFLSANYPQHQYIFSTHTFDVIAWASDPAVFQVSTIDGQSSARAVDLSEIEHLRDIAREIGFSLSDVFGAERIIWVEGPTEQAVFPEIMREFGIAMPQSTSMLPLKSTAPFVSGKKSAAASDLYGRIASAVSPFSRGAIFAVDRETLTDEQVTEIEAATPGRVAISSRRTLENFLIETEAIAKLISNELDADGSGSKIDKELVDKWLSENAGDRKYGASAVWSGDASAEEWISRVDGAKLLADLCQHVSDAKFTYNKKEHGPRLAVLIMQKEKQLLEPLSDHIGRVMKMASAL